MNLKNKAEGFFWSVTAFLLFIPSRAVFAGDVKLENPLGDKVKTLPDFVVLILDNIVIPIGGVIVVFFVIYSGFLFVKARGKPEEIKTAIKTFQYTIIGALVLLGAKVIAGVIQGTIGALK